MKNLLSIFCIILIQLQTIYFEIKKDQSAEQKYIMISVFYRVRLVLTSVLWNKPYLLKTFMK